MEERLPGGRRGRNIRGKAAGRTPYWLSVTTLQALMRALTRPTYMARRQAQQQV